MPGIMTLTEAAPFLRISDRTARQWAADGTLPVRVVTVNGQRRVLLKDLTQYVEDGISQAPKTFDNNAIEAAS
jgi:excisionase family DNA binding protein